MGCKLCGRNSCTESFHTLKEQEDFVNKTGQYAPEPDPELERKAALADRAMRALESLTPGGSEYVNDPERCVATVREVRGNLNKLLVDKTMQLHKESKLADELAAALSKALPYLLICKATHPNDDLASEQARIAEAALAKWEAPR